MVVFLVYIILFGIITVAVGSVVSGKALDFIEESNSYLRSKIKRAALFGALAGCVAADLFSSAYVLAIAAGVMGEISGNVGGGAEEVLGIFAGIKILEHLFVLTSVAFAVSAATCWTSLTHFRAREAAGLPTMPMTPVPAATASHFCAQCGTAMVEGSKFCQQCGTPEVAPD